MPQRCAEMVNIENQSRARQRQLFEDLVHPSVPGSVTAGIAAKVHQEMRVIPRAFPTDVHGTHISRFWHLTWACASYKPPSALVRVRFSFGAVRLQGG
ncbi:hypothetical protein NOVOSPHI9U_10409 [Novosphingobium sp. 9U]|nr:hypothetical protein NOVOSPHI9U_10409 [Novosphingobium sp. 9U]